MSLSGRHFFYSFCYTMGNKHRRQKMNDKMTELVMILDKSGSMSGLEKDTIGGYNAKLEKQKAQEGSIHVTTVLFDHHIEILHDRLPIGCIEPLTEKEYQVGGMTALLDAVGSTINRIDKIQQAEAEEKRAGKVIFVITMGLKIPAMNTAIPH